MRAAALAVVLAGGAALANPGRVVRVERPKATGGSSTICGELRGTAGICLGPKPRVGDHVVLADATQAFEVVIHTVEPLTSLVNPSTTRPAPPGCDGVLWTITMDAHARVPSQVFGVVGNFDVTRVRGVADLDKIPSPTGEPTDHLFGALDLDGDAAPDVLMGVTACKDTVQHCLVIWDRQGAKFVATSMIPLEICAQ